MRKLMIAMLALAVVFGFAACDNSTSTSGTGSQLDIAYIVGTEVNDKDYLAGDAADPADFKFTGYDAADNVVIENMSAELFAAKGTLSAADDEAVFTYNGMGLFAGKDVKVPVDVYAIEKITVDSSKVNKNYYTIVQTGSNGAVSDATIGEGGAYEEYAKVDTANLVVTATYDTDKTVVLDETQYTAEIGTVTGDNGAGWTKFTAADWSAISISKKAAVKVMANGGGDPVYYDVNYMLNKVSGVYFDVTKDYTVWYAKDATSDTATLSNTDIVLYGKMLNGQEKYSLTGATYGLVDEQNATGNWSSLKINQGVDHVVVYAQYKGNNVAPDAPKVMTAKTDSIPVKEDYETGITAVEKSTGVVLTIGKDYSKIEAADASTDATELGSTYLEVKYTWASKKDTTSDKALDFHAEEDGFSLSKELFAEADYSARTDVPVNVVVGDFTAQILVNLKNA